MTTADITAILTDILNLTKDNKIRWTSTSTDAQFMTTLGDASIIIDQFSMGQNANYYTLSIYNNKGNVIYHYDTTQCEDVTISSLIEKIYIAAENLFYKRDETIQSIKNALSKIMNNPT